MKLVESDILVKADIVAPHAGVWIETSCLANRATNASRSPPTRGCGLKLLATSTMELLVVSRPPRGGVD